jgi:hypothetical protein
MLSSRKSDPWEQQVIHPDQDMHLCVYGGWMMNSFLHMILSSPFEIFETWAMFLYSFSLFFFHALELVFFFSPFLEHIVLAEYFWRESNHGTMREALFVEWMGDR